MKLWWSESVWGLARGREVGQGLAQVPLSKGYTYRLRGPAHISTGSPEREEEQCDEVLVEVFMNPSDHLETVGRVNPEPTAKPRPQT